MKHIGVIIVIICLISLFGLILYLENEIAKLRQELADKEKEIAMLKEKLNQTNPSQTRNEESATPEPTTTMTTSSSFEDQLLKDVLSAPYNTTDYKKNEFDCSNMAALLYDWLKLKGYDVKFVFTMGEQWYGHAWLLVGNITVPNICTSEFCVAKKRTADGKGMVIIIHNYGSVDNINRLLGNNTYWVEPTTKTVFRNLTPFYGWRKIYIFDDYRHSYGDIAYLLLMPPQEEFNYTWYLEKHYGKSSLVELLSKR